MSDQPCFELVRAPAGPAEDLARAVTLGLAEPPRSLPCRFLYDEQGSRLFEAICQMEEYYLSRAEREILEARAGELAERFAGSAVVELGSGNSAKTELLLAALCADGRAARYVPVDIWPGVLEVAGERLTAALPSLSVLAVAGEYEAALTEVAARLRGPKLVLWLGNNVGNFERPQAADFLAAVGRHLGPADALLLGADLRKDQRVLERAYDDRAGLTARFSLNLLARINSELGADFDLDRFRHRARYDPELGVVRMHLVSLADQTVHVAALEREFRLKEGEAIHTEDSWKYSRAELAALAGGSGYGLAEHWTDAAGRFSLNLLVPRR